MIAIYFNKCPSHFCRRKTLLWALSCANVQEAIYYLSFVTQTWIPLLTNCADVIFPRYFVYVRFYDSNFSAKEYFFNYKKILTFCGELQCDLPVHRIQ